MARYEFIDDEPQAQESTGQAIGRGIARSGARAVESIVGMPGDLIALGRDIVSGVTGADLGNRTLLPESKDIRERVTEPLTGDYLKPQGAGEAFLDQIVGEAASLLLPSGVVGKAAKAGSKLGAAKTIGKAAAKATAKSALANVSGWAAEEMGAGPIGQAAVRIGSVALANGIGALTGGRKALQNLKDTSYKQAQDALKGNPTINIAPELRKIDKLISKINKSDIADKDFLVKRLENVKEIATKKVPAMAGKRVPSGLLDFEGKPLTTRLKGTPGVKGGIAPIKDLLRIKQGWNDQVSTKELTKMGNHYYKEGMDIIKGAIGRYGAKNPDFYKPFLQAEDIHKGMVASNWILDKYNKVGNSLKNPLTNALLFGAGSGLPKVSATGIVGFIGAHEIARAVSLINNSATARQYYKNALKSALTGNKRAFEAAALALDKTLTKEEKNRVPLSGRYEFID